MHMMHMHMYAHVHVTCACVHIGAISSHLRGHGARAVCDEDEGLAEGDLLVEGEAARGEGGAHTRQHLGGGHAGDHGGGRILGQAQQADAQPPPHVLRRRRGGGQAAARRDRRGELQVVRREVIELRPELRPDR